MAQICKKEGLQCVCVQQDTGNATSISAMLERGQNNVSNTGDPKGSDLQGEEDQQRDIEDTEELLDELSELEKINVNSVKESLMNAEPVDTSCDKKHKQKPRKILGTRTTRSQSKKYPQVE